MKAAFDVLSSLLDKITTYAGQLFDGIKDAVSTFNEYLNLLPSGLIAIGATIIVLLVIFRVLGRDA